jgi:hypothetical protein
VVYVALNEQSHSPTRRAHTARDAPNRPTGGRRMEALVRPPSSPPRPEERKKKEGGEDLGIEVDRNKSNISIVSTYMIFPHAGGDHRWWWGSSAASSDMGGSRNATPRRHARAQKSLGLLCARPTDFRSPNLTWKQASLHRRCPCSLLLGGFLGTSDVNNDGDTYHRKNHNESDQQYALFPPRLGLVI